MSSGDARPPPPPVRAHPLAAGALLAAAEPGIRRHPGGDARSASWVLRQGRVGESVVVVKCGEAGLSNRANGLFSDSGDLACKLWATQEAPAPRLVVAQPALRAPPRAATKPRATRAFSDASNAPSLRACPLRYPHSLRAPCRRCLAGVPKPRRRQPLLEKQRGLLKMSHGLMAKMLDSSSKGLQLNPQGCTCILYGDRSTNTCKHTQKIIMALVRQVLPHTVLPPS